MRKYVRRQVPLLEIMTNEADSAAKIIVVGVGGAGNNAVNRTVSYTHLLYDSSDNGKYKAGSAPSFIIGILPA